MKLFLIGYMGCGKSTTGRRVAKQLEVKYADTDALVEEREGASVNDIFYYEGEEYFRMAERRAVETLLESGDDLIVATGGGLPTWRDNMQLLIDHGTTIYLRRSAEQILSRLSDYGRQKRPMFRDKSDEELLEFMNKQMAEREIFYSKARLSVDCTTRSDDEVVEYVVENL